MAHQFLISLSNQIKSITLLGTSVPRISTSRFLLLLPYILHFFYSFSNLANNSLISFMSSLVSFMSPSIATILLFISSKSTFISKSFAFFSSIALSCITTFLSLLPTFCQSSEVSLRRRAPLDLEGHVEIQLKFFLQQSSAVDDKSSISHCSAIPPQFGPSSSLQS